MTKLRSTSIALFLALATLALGACGDDKGSNESANTGADTTAAGTTETGTTETGTTKTGTTKKRTRTGKTETGDDKGGRRGGSDDSSGSGSGKSGSDSPEKELSGKNVYSTSKTVCSSFLPTALQKQLKDGDKSAEDIATDYSKGYPAEERKRAHDGCLAGLKGKG